MENEKIKLWEVIVLILVIILILFLGNITRKIIILNNLENKVSEVNSRSNIYSKTETSSVIGEIYKIDNVVKAIVNNKGENIIRTQITNGDTQLIFTETIDGKDCYGIQEKNNNNRYVPEECESDILYVEKKQDYQ